MTPEQVKEFQKAIGVAEWKLDLWRFAEALGSDADHEYTKEKFLALQKLNKALSQFDAATLAKIINAAQEHPPANETPAHRSTMTAVREMKDRSQQGAIQLGALFTALVLIVCSLAIGYACGRKAVCDAPASSVTKPTK